MNQETGIQGQVAMVTGAASGLGLAIAQRLARDGARTYLADVNVPGAQAAAQELQAAGLQAEAIELDVADSAAVDRVFGEYFAERIDILVNNAGILRTGPEIHETSNEAWADTLAVMQSGVFYCSRAAGRVMVRRRSGNIVNISSIRGFSSAPGRTTYSTHKAAIIMMTKVAAAELGKYGIRVNAVAPGFIRTAMHEIDVAKGITDEPYYLRTIPLGRFGEPEDVAKVVRFLAGPQASYVTGACLVADGGLTTVAAG
jgi:3-oxoacyl-[acyl-carrier protein] reductase